MHSRDVDISNMRGESLQCVYCSYEWRSGHVYSRCGKWVYMPAYMYLGVHGIWSIELCSGCVDISDMPAECLQRNRSTYKRKSGYVYIQCFGWVYMSAYL